MASSATSEGDLGTRQSDSHNTVVRQHSSASPGQSTQTSDPSQVEPVEMSVLSTQNKPDPLRIEPDRRSRDDQVTAPEDPEASEAGRDNTPTSTNKSRLVSAEPNQSPRSESAIGPATDKPFQIASSTSAGPQLTMTLLLHSTETRHPYVINGKYLSKRNVNVTDNDPLNMSVYTLKELIWRDWREGSFEVFTPLLGHLDLMLRRMGTSTCKSNINTPDPYGKDAG